jgi:orotidine-5'-phosphate decarboxylase
MTATAVPARERIILSIDTSDRREAERLVGVARDAGAACVKMGLQLQTAESWRYCSRLAARNGLRWVDDAKLDDIPNTVAEATRNICDLDHPPFGITMHTTAGTDAMHAAQEVAGDIKMLGVTVLTSINEDEGMRLYRVPVPQKVIELAHDAAAAGIAGFVSSPLEVGAIKRDPVTQHLFGMIPGSRSASVGHGDQARVGTPAAAIQDGADLLVIGRQITQAPNPAHAYELLVAEIEGAVR